MAMIAGAVLVGAALFMSAVGQAVMANGVDGRIDVLPSASSRG
ncbi:MAG: hypothetical protein ACRDPJ_04635 [Nocardioidaceae bacterium]